MTIVRPWSRPGWNMNSVRTGCHTDERGLTIVTETRGLDHRSLVVTPWLEHEQCTYWLSHRRVGLDHCHGDQRDLTIARSWSRPGLEHEQCTYGLSHRRVGLDHCHGDQRDLTIARSWSRPGLEHEQCTYGLSHRRGGLSDVFHAGKSADTHNSQGGTRKFN